MPCEDLLDSSQQQVLGENIESASTHSSNTSSLAWPSHIQAEEYAFALHRDVENARQRRAAAFVASQARRYAGAHIGSPSRVFAPATVATPSLGSWDIGSVGNSDPGGYIDTEAMYREAEARSSIQDPRARGSESGGQGSHQQPPPPPPQGAHDPIHNSIPEITNEEAERATALSSGRAIPPLRESHGRARWISKATHKLLWTRFRSLGAIDLEVLLSDGYFTEGPRADRASIGEARDSLFHSFHDESGFNRFSLTKRQQVQGQRTKYFVDFNPQYKAWKERQHRDEHRERHRRSR
jgi:hypothetical protein